VSNQPSVKMKCNEIVRLLPPYLDGELAGRTQVAVTDHLASCAACREELGALRVDLALLRSGTVPEPAAFIATRAMAEIRQKGRPAPRRFGRLAGTVAAALVVAVSIGAGVFFGSGLAQPTTTAAANSTEAAVNYVESTTADMYSMMAGGD
jgi:anti-sigma factor RsiW